MSSLALRVPRSLFFLGRCTCHARITLQSFYQMDVDATPQWVIAYPEADSPRTGDGLFAGEVIEVLQVSLGTQTRLVRRMIYHLNSLVLVC